VAVGSLTMQLLAEAADALSTRAAATSASFGIMGFLLWRE
jgi:hypothetical protein